MKEDSSWVLRLVTTKKRAADLLDERGFEQIKSADGPFSFFLGRFKPR